MDYVVVEGVPPYDGRYEWDYAGAPFTTREWGWIKRHANYLPLTLGREALGDPEFIAVLAVIVLRRAGRVETRDVADALDRLADAPFGATVTLELNTAEEDEDVSPPPGSSNGSESFSGAASTTNTGRSDSPPKPTGHPPPATSASVSATSGK